MVDSISSLSLSGADICTDFGRPIQGINSAPEIVFEDESDMIDRYSVRVIWPAVFSPLVVCDRIGVKDNTVYFP